MVLHVKGKNNLTHTSLVLHKKLIDYFYVEYRVESPIYCEGRLIRKKKQYSSEDTLHNISKFVQYFTMCLPKFMLRLTGND